MKFFSSHVEIIRQTNQEILYTIMLMRFALILWAVLLTSSIVCAAIWYCYDNVYSQVYQLPCVSKRSYGFCYVDQCFMPSPTSLCVVLFGVPLNSGQHVWNEPPTTPPGIIVATVTSSAACFLLSIYLCSTCLEAVETEGREGREASAIQIIITPPEQTEAERTLSQDSSRALSQESMSRVELLVS
jgi:hypothetical protein